MFVFVKAFLLLFVFNCVKGDCHDEYDICPDYTHLCETNNKVKTYCKASCGRCPDECEDQDDWCPDFARWGDCQRYPEFMKEECKKSCNFCTGSGSGSGSSSSCQCGMKKASRIVGGQETEVNEYPWMAALMMEKYGRLSSLCGGSLIAANWVITAAHCFYNDNGRQVLYEKNTRIHLGEHDFTTDSESSITKTIKVEKIVLHKNYNPFSRIYENDIALVKLSEPVDLNIYTPVCLPSSDADYTGKNGWVYGWGTTEPLKPGQKPSAGSSSDKLLEIQKQIVSDARYRSVMRQSHIKDSMLCAGGVAGEDSCAGDSGGPFTVAVNNQKFLAGVVSWGRGCAQDNTYGVYSETAKFRMWIDKMMNAYGGGDKCEDY